MAAYANGLIEWGGGAGQPVYVRQPDGTMKNVGAPEHGESASYVARAVSDPQVEKVLALYNAAPEMLNNEQKAFIASGMVGMDSFGQGYRWSPQNLFDNVFDPQQSGALLQTGFASYLSPQDVSAGQQFNYNESPAQQSARDDDGGMFGDLGPLLLAGAGLYFGMPYLSEAFGGAAGMLGGEAAAAAAGAEAAGGLSWLGNTGLATIPEAVAGMGAGTAAAGGAALGSGLTAGGGTGLTFGGEGMLTGEALGSGISASAGGITGATAGGMGVTGLTGTIPGVGTLTSAGMLIPAAGGAAIPLASASPSILSSVANWASNITGTPISGAQLLSGGANILGGILSGNAAQDAAQTTANAQLEAARMAAEAAKFKPFGLVATDPRIKAQQAQIFDASQGMLNQFTQSPQTTAPMGTAAQRAMSLGNQYLATDPQAQAQKYYNDQQALMATQRARDQAGMLTGEFNRGTYGLATGATGQMGAANPRLEAMFNAQRQQDLGLAAAATQGGMDYAKFGTGMVDAGGGLLRSMYGTQVASAAPWQTALGMGTSLEGDAGGTAAKFLGQGMVNAAQTQQAGAYSPLGTALMGGANAIQGWQNQTAQQTQQAQQNQMLTNAINNWGLRSTGL